MPGGANRTAPRARAFLALAMALGALLPVPAARAEIPEPDTVLYGSVAIDHEFITADRDDVVVELRASPDGPVLNGYRMGSDPVAGNFYLLRVKTESLEPLSEPDAVLLGSSVHLTVVDESGPRLEATYTIEAPGKIVRLDFGDVDTDGDGMSDSFELEHFGSTTSGDPDEDSDGDGRPNLREFLQGTDPNVPDGQHPADLSPGDWAINIQEVTEYALAWKVGEAWPIEPSVIPVDYVTRASALWVGGEAYVFQNTPPTTAPLWWVSAPSPGLSALDGPESGSSSAAPTSEATPIDGDTDEKRQIRERLLDEALAAREAFVRESASRRAPASRGASSETEPQATRILPSEVSPGRNVRVTLQIVPNAGARAFAIEERPPAGWRVRSVSAQGRWDSKNQRIKWGPFYGSDTRALEYEISPQGDVTARFDGVASFDGRSVRIAGGSRVGADDPAPVALVARVDSQGVLLRAEGTPGATYRVEASADLSTWTPLDALRADESGRIEFRATTENGAAFFRLRAE
jgi:hypothetical protein